MNSEAGIFFLIITSFILPLCLMAVAAKKSGSPKSVACGALCFFIFQVCTRIPLIQYVLPMHAGFVMLQQRGAAIYLLLFSFSAGIFEECGSYIVYKLFKINKLRYAVAFGIGHGGIESILFVGINAIAMIFRPEELYTVPLENIYIAGVERIFAMLAHVGFSIIVLCSRKKGKRRLLIAAILLHGLFNFTAARLYACGVSIIMVEVFAAAASAAIFLFSKILWKRI